VIVVSVDLNGINATLRQTMLSRICVKIFSFDRICTNTRIGLLLDNRQTRRRTLISHGSNIIYLPVQPGIVLHAMR